MRHKTRGSEDVEEGDSKHGGGAAVAGQGRKHPCYTFKGQGHRAGIGAGALVFAPLSSSSCTTSVFASQLVP
jgi:hypothetical protein